MIFDTRNLPWYKWPLLVLFVAVAVPFVLAADALRAVTRVFR